MEDLMYLDMIGKMAEYWIENPDECPDQFKEIINEVKTEIEK